MASSMTQLSLIRNLFSPKDARKPTPSRSASSFAEHYATLLTLQGYFDLLELESIVQAKDGVWEFRRDSRKIRALPFSKYRKTFPINIDEFKDELHRLWTRPATEKNSDCNYWLVIDANLKAFSNEFDSERSLVDNVFGESANIPESSRTFAVVLRDAKSEASKLIAEQLDIDEFYADIIRQLVSQLIHETATKSNQTIFAKPKQVSKANIHWIIRDVLLHRSRASFDPIKLSRAVSIVTFPSTEAKHPASSNLSIQPEHLSSKNFVDRPELVEEVLQKLKLFRSCAITAEIGTGMSALLWSVVHQTSDNRCWYQVTSTSPLDIASLSKVIASYKFDYPIGFVIDNINLSNSRIFRSLIELTKFNKNIWVAGTVSSMDCYLVSAEKSLAIYPLYFDEEFDKVLVAQTAEILSDSEESKKEIEKLITETDPDSDPAVAHGRISINHSLDDLLLNKYAITMRNTLKQGGLKPTSKSVSFRKSKKSRKLKTRQKQKSSQAAQMQPPIEPKKEYSTEDQQLMQDRNDELDVLIAIALVTAIEGRVTIASLQANLTLEAHRLNSAIDRVQALGLYFKDETDHTVFGVHPVSAHGMCRALVEVGFTSWSELASAAIENVDSNLLEEIAAHVAGLEFLSNSEITTAVKSRFENRKHHSLSVAGSSENSPTSQEDLDIISRDLEEWVKLARGIFQGNLLKITRDWVKTFRFPQLTQRYCLPAVSYAITGTKSFALSDPYISDAYPRGESWFKRIQSTKLPRIISSNIVDILTEQFDRLAPELICDAMDVLQIHRVERHYVKQLCDIHSTVASTFVSLNIDHVMKILDLAYCLSPELFDEWVQAYNQLEGTDPLEIRVQENTPFALPWKEDDDGFGKILAANIHKDILNDNEIDVQNIVNQYSHSLRLLDPDSVYTQTAIVDENGKEIRSAPINVIHKKEVTLARQNFAVNSGITVSKFVGAQSWADYLETATKTLEEIHAIGSVYLNLVCCKFDTEEIYEKLFPFFLKGVKLKAPFDSNRYKYNEEFELQPLQRILLGLNLNAFLGFRDLPENARFYYEEAQRIRTSCHRAYGEPWEHVGGESPSILEDVENLARDMQTVGLVAEELQMHPIERWRVPPTLTETSFAYIASLCRQNMSMTQRQELEITDVFVNKIKMEDMTVPLPDKLRALQKRES